MNTHWENMTPDEKADQLRQQLRMLARDTENGQRALNDRIVRLEQTLERFERLQPVKR